MAIALLVVQAENDPFVSACFPYVDGLLLPHSPPVGDHLLWGLLGICLRVSSLGWRTEVWRLGELTLGKGMSEPLANGWPGMLPDCTGVMRDEAFLLLRKPWGLFALAVWKCRGEGKAVCHWVTLGVC